MERLTDARIPALLPVDTARGTLYPACVVCGRDHNLEAPWKLDTVPGRREGTIIAGESCDDCFSWLADVEGGLV